MSSTADAKDSESIAAAEAANKGTPAQDVLRWLHGTHHGVLSTLTTEKAVTGFPTGSIVPFALDHAGRPFIFIANIALHTRNLKKDNRASLFVHDGMAEGDPQSTWRISVLGKFVRLNPGADAADDPNSEAITQEEHDQLMARYVERVPKARTYANTHGFHFWRMSEVDSIRYIAGFGRICSFPGSEYLEVAAPSVFEKMRAGALSHMNDDHEHNMQEICHRLHGVEAEQVQMASLDLTGCLFKTSGPDGFHYNSFDSVVDRPDKFKSEIITLLTHARQAQV